jgi:hypothetical protein
MVDNEMNKCNQCIYARICHEECVAICEDGGEKEIEKYIDKGYEKCDLQHQLKVSEKALELACKEITGSCEYCSYKTRIECPVEANCLDEKINYFKIKAKEIMKSE